MALRVIELVLPEREAKAFPEAVEGHLRGGPWVITLDGGKQRLRFVLDADESGSVVDEIERRFGHAPGFHLLILPVHAMLPRPPEPPKEDKPAAEAKPRRYGSKRGGLSREELYGEALDMAKPKGVFYATVILSTVVVSIGLLRDNTAAIIGAMVIAPLLGPNVALGLATTLADTRLLKHGLRSNVIGFVIALGVTIALGVILEVRTTTHEIEARTSVHVSDILLALAAGSAGALAITTGVPTALVGVMVAVALLPPTAVIGLMIGSGHMGLAGGAALLLAVNLICVNLAATAAFLAQGIRPRTWWEADRARRASRTALIFGTVLVLVLLALILYTQQS